VSQCLLLLLVSSATATASCCHWLPADSSRYLCTTLINSSSLILVLKMLSTLEVCWLRTLFIKGKTIESEPKFIKSGDAAIVKLVPSKPMCLSPSASLLHLDVSLSET